MVIGNNEDGEDGATKDWLLMMRAAIMMMAMRIIVRAMMMLKRLAFSRDHSSHFRDKFTTEGVYNEDDDGEYVEDGGDDVGVADDVEKTCLLP